MTTHLDNPPYGGQTNPQLVHSICIFQLSFDLPKVNVRIFTIPRNVYASSHKVGVHSVMLLVGYHLIICVVAQQLSHT